MKIIKIKNSLLFLSIDPKKDEVKCCLIYFFSWFTWSVNTNVFNLNEFSLSLVKDFYIKTVDDWNRKYRI